jgi:hypothetical protein
MCNVCGNLTGKAMRAIAAAALFFASGVMLSTTDASATWLRAAQAAGQNATQNSSQNSGSKSGQGSGPTSAARQTNRVQQTPASPPAGQNGVRDTYKPANAVAAADAQYPLQTAADAIVVFDVSIGARGEVKKTSVLVDVPPFTATAEQSLRNWKFAPATQNGQAEDSEMLVAFVFRHAVYVANPPAFSPIYPAKESEGGRSDFIAPAILYASYAGYPASTVAQGTVVVQANVNAGGSTGDVSVLRDLPGGFAPLAMDAAKHWRFQSALRDGRAVPSKVAIAFVFSSRAMNPF